MVDNERSGSLRDTTRDARVTDDAGASCDEYSGVRPLTVSTTGVQDER
jgi:hypothetical protein